MKKVLLLAVLMVVFGATMVSAAAKKNIKDVTIGVSNYTLGAPYYAGMSAHIAISAKAAGFKNVLQTDAANDMTKQLADIEDLLAKKIDVLVINPKDPKGIIPAIKAATKQGVPVFIIDSGIDSKANYVSYIGADNVENSQLLGEFIAKQMKGKQIKMAVLSGNKGNAVGLSRRGNLFLGLTEAQLQLSNTSSFEIVTQGWGGWNAQEGMAATEDILTAHPDINLLYAENDDMGLGAIKALKERNKLKDVMVVGFDGQKQGYEAIISGEMAATALNSPPIIAETTVQTISSYLKGIKVPNRIITPPVLVTKENVKKYYNKGSIF